MIIEVVARKVPTAAQGLPAPAVSNSPTSCAATDTAITPGTLLDVSTTPIGQVTRSTNDSGNLRSKRDLNLADLVFEPIKPRYENDLCRSTCSSISRSRA